MLRDLRSFWLRLARVKRVHGDFDEELQSHLAMHVDDAMRSGLSEAEARREAMLRLGGSEQVRQAYREQAGLPWLEMFLADLRYALRGFRRAPLFAVTAVVTLALGIGATTAVLSVVDRILFRSLPYAHDDRLVSFGLSQSLEKQEFTLGGFFFAWRDEQKPFAAVTYERGVAECNLTEQHPVQLHCGAVAANFLPTLGVQPALGRTFLTEEDEPHGPRVAMISDALWQARYNRQASVLDSTMELDGQRVRIIGVLPRDFEMPRLQPVDVLLPAQVDIAAQHTQNAGIGVPLWAFARLKPGVSLAEAKAEMAPLFQRTWQWIPAGIRNDFHLEIRSIRDRQMQDAYRAAWVLLGAVTAMLLIACANVAGLLLARSAARQRERAVRAALGASRRRLMGQSLSEAALIGLAGGAGGLAVALGLLRGFTTLAPAGIPFLQHAGLDLRIAFFAGLATLSCTLLFGMASALQPAVLGSLAARARPFSARARLRRALVVVQIGTCVVLLSGAMLLLRSFRMLTEQSPGLATRNVVTLRASLASARYPDPKAYMNFYLRAEEALRRLPGVTAVGLSDSLPPGADSWFDGRRIADMVVPGRPPLAAAGSETVVVRRVTPDYFKVLGIRIESGQAFTEAERSLSEHPVIANQRLASRLFPGEDAVGKRFQLADYQPRYVLSPTVYTIVGVAADVKNEGLAAASAPEYDLLRRDRDEDWSSHAVFVLQTTLPPSVIAPWANAAIAGIDPTAPVEVERMSSVVSRLTDRPRFEAALLSFFAMIGLAMAVIGLHGLMAYLAVQRTQEIGVRMALGADRGAILRLMLGEGLRLVIGGGVAGIAAAWLLARVLKSLLFAIGPHDPVSYVAVAVVLGLVALVALLLPARRAAAVNPTDALRAE